jgi:putative oxidoreductase
MTLGAIAVRGVVGPLFIGHGAQKLFGSFGGHGLEGTAGFFESLGLRPGRRAAMAAGIAETGGGALLTLGALTPLATSALTSVMATAIRKVHLQNGPWVANGGYEYNLALIAVLTALADTGPGKPSVDAARLPWLKGPAWALLSLGAGVAGSFLATSERFSGGGPAPADADVAGDPATATSGPITQTAG